jgi:Flp pilus assembly protein TadG
VTPGHRSSGSPTHPARRNHRRELGQSLVEFGIILPFVLVMLIGVIEVTTAFVHYVSVVNASRDAARFGSKGFTDADIRAAAAIDLGKLPNAIKITPTSAITINRTPPAGLAGDNVVTVKVCYDHHTLLSIGLIIPDIVPICDSTTMRIIPTPSP